MAGAAAAVAVIAAMSFSQRRLHERPPVPVECEWYQREINKTKICMDDDGCGHSTESNEKYVEHMQAELEYCTARYTVTNELPRQP